jgi:oligopeptide transport system substrate-binding protein
LIVVAGGYVYINFFQEDEADEVCCAKHELTPPKVLTITESTPIPILDSSKANQQITYNILNQVQEGLMRLGPNDIPVPGLAESYQVSPDYRTYTFIIRKNAVWSDGKAVTAHDFKFAWERALSPANEYEYSFLFYPIHNAEAYSNGVVNSDQIGITATDDRHLTIKLEKPDPNFLSLVTLTPFLPLRSDLIEKYGEGYASSAEKMSFTGPFKLTAYNPQSAGLVKNDLYWDANAIKLSQAIINVEVDQKKRISLYKSELMAMSKTFSSYTNGMKSKDMKLSPKSISNYIVMNQNKEIFSNAKIRKAIQIAINNKEISSDFKGETTPINSLVPPVLITSNQEIFRTNISSSSQISKAKEILNKGLSELKIDKFPPVKLVTTEGDVRLTTQANLLKRQLSMVGITVNIYKYPVKQKGRILLDGDYDLSINEWSAEYHDPSIFLMIGHSRVKDNISGFADPHYDSLLDKASLEANPTKRDQLLQQAERYLIEEKAVVVPLVHVNDLRLQKSYVKNVLYHPFGADYTLKWATYQPPKKVAATK